MTEQVETERRTDSINLSSVAAAKVKSLLEQEGRDDLQLRISVQPGGCSGLRYQLFFDERTLDGDVVTDVDGVAVVVEEQRPDRHRDERRRGPRSAVGRHHVDMVQQHQRRQIAAFQARP